MVKGCVSKTTKDLQLFHIFVTHIRMHDSSTIVAGVERSFATGRCDFGRQDPRPDFFTLVVFKVRQQTQVL